MAPPSDDEMPPTPQAQEAAQGPRNTTSSAAPEGNVVKCPRCDSSNTKFCYYNNYSLSQPRHFCKTCRRYWTNGGALRNVPIGGGCRKNKKPKPSSSSSSSRLSYEAKDFPFHNLSVPPSVEFQAGGLSYLSRFHPTPPTMFNQFSSSFGDGSGTSSLNLSGFQLDPPPPPAAANPLTGPAPPNPNLWALGQSQSPALPHPVNRSMQHMNVRGNLASSIESLSNMNQDMHMKMQQQRFAMMFSGDSSSSTTTTTQKSYNGVVSPPQTVSGFDIQKPQPILFQNLELSKTENLQGGGSGKGGAASEAVPVIPTEWFFDNPFSSVNPATASVIGGNVNNGNARQSDVNNWGGVHSWGNFNGLP